MPWKSRSLLLALLSLGYVLTAALRASSVGAAGILAVLLLPVGLIAVWVRSVPPARGEDWVSPVTRTAMRACGVGTALTAAARVAPVNTPPLEAIAALGTSMACAAMLVALARIAPLGGLLIVPPSAKRLLAAIVVGALGVLAAGASFVESIASNVLLLDFSLAQAIGATAAILSIGTSIVVAWRLRKLRRLDLGASERLSAALVVAAVALLVGLVAALEQLTYASRILQLAACLSALGASAACLARDPTAVARTHRTTVAVAILGAPAALIAASMAAQFPRQGELITVLALAVGIGVGLGAVPLARPLGPEQSRWIGAAQRALAAALRSDPETAITTTLATLREALGPSPGAPELWRLDPPTLMTVDRAGYGRHESGAAPPRLLFDLAEGEPEQTIRTDVLETLEVRRADIRPALDWMRARGALSLTLLADEEGAIGGLVLPVGGRAHPLALEEVRVLRALADRLTALLGVSGAVARARLREIEARQSADREENRALELEQGVTSDTKRHEALTRRLARPAFIAPYSPAARLALEELERAGREGAPLSLLTPPGIDPIPYAAVVHGARSRRSGPFVVIDGAGVLEQQEASWRDPVSSPLCLADGGSLLILGVAALTAEAQEYLAQALTDLRSPKEDGAPLELSIIVSVPTTVDVLVASGRLQSRLAARLADRAIALPPLSARAEDLRAILVDRLARLGVRLKGRPMGLDPRALGRLIEHDWPGNELELDDVLTRAVAVAEGEVLTGAHLDQVGFVGWPPEPRRASQTPAPAHRPLRAIPRS